MRVEIDARLLDRDARLEPAHHLPRVIAAIAERVGLHRRPRAGVPGNSKPGGITPMTVCGTPLTMIDCPMAFGLRLEPIAPDAVAQDDHLGRADAIFVLAEVAAERRRDAERRGTWSTTRLPPWHVVGAVAGREVVRRPV